MSLIHGGGTNIPHATGQLSPSTNYWACALWSLHTQLESPVCCKERPHVLPLRPTAAECLECTGSLWILHTQLMVQKNSTFSKEWGGFGSWKKWEPQFRVNTYKYKVKPQRMLCLATIPSHPSRAVGGQGMSSESPLCFPSLHHMTPVMRKTCHMIGGNFHWNYGIRWACCLLHLGQQQKPVSKHFSYYLVSLVLQATFFFFFN